MIASRAGLARAAVGMAMLAAACASTPSRPAAEAEGRAAGVRAAGADGGAADAGAPANAAPSADGGAAASAAEPPPGAPEPPPMTDAPYRQEKPAPLAVQPRFVAPVPALRSLKNGAKVLLVENHALPLVALDVVFLHGTDADPLDKAGLAEFMADTVDEGTQTRTATQLAEQIEDLAAQISAGAGRETASAHLDCLAETLPQALELLADIVQHPAFREEDVERVRTLRLTQLQQKNASPGALASDEAARILYGPRHPWGQPSGGTPQSIASITPADLAKFHQTWWVPNNAVIAVSGDVTAAQLTRLLEEKFGQWKPHPLPKIALPAVPALHAGVVALDKPGTSQSQVWVLGRMFAARHPDALAMRIANMVLGGLFTSRLNMNLREKNAYSYGVGSGLILDRAAGTFRAAGGVIAKNTVDSVREFESELKRFSDGQVSDEELAKAKEAFTRSLPSVLETNGAVAGGMARLYSVGLPLDYYKALPGRVAKLNRAAIARVVKKWLKPAQWPVVIVGPVAQSGDELRKLGLGPVELRAAPGAPPPVAPPPPAGTQPAPPAPVAPPPAGTPPTAPPPTAPPPTAPPPTAPPPGDAAPRPPAK